jgi:hypothetical protein
MCLFFSNIIRHMPSFVFWCFSLPSVSEERPLDWSCLSVRIFQLEKLWTDLDEI